MLSGVLLAITLSLLPQAETAQTAPDAQSELTAGHYEQARDGFEALLGADPANTVAQAGEVQASERIALAQRAQGDNSGALETLLRAKKFAPENAHLLLDLGVLEDEMKLYWDADGVLAHAAQIDPGNPTILYAVARVKLDLQQTGPAEQAMRSYLQLRPEDASAHYGLGHILQTAQRPEEARAEFERSVALQPQQTESYYQLGQIALESGKYDEALGYYAKTLAGDPKHGGALAGAGIAHFRQKQYGEAEKSLEEAVAHAPDYQPSHYYLGLTLARLGRKQDSDRELALAAKMAEEQNSASAQRMRIQQP